MFKLFDRVKVSIATTGTGDVTFGSASSNAFLTPTEAGAADGDTIRYVIVDGTDFEEGIGTIKSSVAAMERTTVTKSKIGGTVGTDKLDLSGAAVLAIPGSAKDILIPVNNLADLDDTDTALDNLGGTTVGKAVFTAANAAGARTAIGAGTGTVTSVGLTNTYGLTVTSSPITTSGNINAEVGLSSASAVLGSDVSLSSTSTYFDGPSMAQGSTGTWFACGTITVQDISNSSSNINVRLWDGATVIASAVVTTQSTNPNARETVTLCGIITNPVGNIRISAKDTSATTGVIKANQSGDAKDGTIYGFRLS